MERQNFCQKLYGIKQKAFRVTLVVVNILLLLLHILARHSRSLRGCRLRLLYSRVVLHMQAIFSLAVLIVKSFP